MKKPREPKEKSVGTIAAEKARAMSNTLSDTQREALLKKGLSIIYGGGRNAKASIGKP